MPGATPSSRARSRCWADNPFPVMAMKTAIQPIARMASLVSFTGKNPLPDPGPEENYRYLGRNNLF
jgi:hypothetical protein